MQPLKTCVDVTSHGVDKCVELAQESEAFSISITDVVATAALLATIVVFIWTGRREHRRWLLDRRLDAYVELDQAGRKFIQALADAQAAGWSGVNFLELRKLASEMESATLRLVARPDRRIMGDTLAISAMNTVDYLQKVVYDPAVPGATINAAVTKVKTQYLNAERAMREEIDPSPLHVRYVGWKAERKAKADEARAAYAAKENPSSSTEQADVDADEEKVDADEEK